MTLGEYVNQRLQQESQLMLAAIATNDTVAKLKYLEYERDFWNAKYLLAKDNRKTPCLN